VKFNKSVLGLLNFIVIRKQYVNWTYGSDLGNILIIEHFRVELIFVSISQRSDLYL
jgi:hypothetical protein